MAEFNVGDDVRSIKTNKRGYVKKVHPAARGRQLYQIFYSQDDIRDENENDLERFLEINDLFDRCMQGDYRGYPDFQVFNTTFKVDNSSNNTLSSIKASKTLFKTYQYIPLMKFLNSEIHRLLIADEVGLGKTIETGHIMLELKARQELRNVLVVCPSSLTNKWQEELLERFGLDFYIYKGVDGVLEDLRTHNGNARGIITYDKIRQQKKLNSLFEFMGNSANKFSLVVCDEAHRIKNKSTKQHKAIDRLLEYADAALFLTATPIMLGRENLFQLLHLLNSQRYENLDAFMDETWHNEPFVWAVNALNSNVSLREIKDGLEERIDEDDYVRDLPMFKPLMEKFEKENTPKQKASIQSDLYDINPLSSIMTRTRKVDVTTDLSQAQRDTKTIPIEFSDVEKELFNRYSSEFEDAQPLARSTHSQQIASSVYAYRNYEDFALKDVPDAKFDKLLDIIAECQKKGNGKVIVFVRYTNTQKYLAIRLNRKKIQYRVISGEDREGRITAVEEFRDLKEVQVLLSTEVGSEGLDMQFCDTIVNYDLPWNPMVVEQRIGRIDRIGQQSKIIHIYSLLVKGSIQEKIYSRLMRRIEDFRQTIGDLEPILSQEFEDTTIGEEIEKLYRTDLTEEELELKMQKVEQAIEHNYLDSIRLEKELSDSFSNDSYLRSHLNSIIRNKAYVTELELENYVRNLLKKDLPTCSISKEKDDVFVISVPQNDKNVIVNFFNKYSTKFQGENNDLINKYISTIRDKSRLRITFSQEIAEKNRNITYLNIYHPFVLVAKEYFRKNLETNSCVFRYKLPKVEIEIDKENDIVSGNYMLAIYDVETIQNRYGLNRKSHEMLPLLYDVENQNLIDDELITEAFYRAIQVSGTSWDAKDSCVLTENVVVDMRAVFNEEVRQYSEERRANITLKQKNDIEHQRKSIEATYNKRISEEQQSIDSFEDILKFCSEQIEKGNGDWIYFQDLSYNEWKKNIESILPARKGLLQTHKNEKDQKINALSDIPNPIVDYKLMMLNLLRVI